MRSFITNAAGFIGTMLDQLLEEGHEIAAWDNFSTGMEEFLAGALNNPRFRLVRGDNLNLPELKRALAFCKKSDMGIHHSTIAKRGRRPKFNCRSISANAPYLNKDMVELRDVLQKVGRKNCSTLASSKGYRSLVRSRT